MSDAAWRGIRLTIRSDPRYLEPVRTVVREATGLIGLDESEGEEVVLAVQEACSNVIRHCYRGCRDERIDLVLGFAGSELTIRIVDYGTFVDPSTIRSRDLEDVRPGGLGVHLIRQLMDAVEYEKNEWGGTTLTLVKRAASPAAGGPGAGPPPAPKTSSS